VGKGKSNPQGGRPSGTGANSDKPVILSETGKDGYVAFKEILKLYPKHIRDRLYNIEIPQDRIREMAEYVQRMSQGVWSVAAMICRGDGCQYSSRCELLMSDAAPVGSPCPVETYMIGIWSDQWVSTLAVDLSNMVEVNQVISIILCDLMIMRLHNALSNSPTGSIIYSPVGVDKFGNVILRTDPAPEVAMEKEYVKLKTTTLNALLATRESKAKHGIMDDRDLAKSGAKTIYKAQQLIKQLESSSKKIGDRAFAEVTAAVVMDTEEIEDSSI
jgi:hypothetical protein